MRTRAFDIVLFDLDGTLADSLYFMRDVYSRFLTSLGNVNESPPFEYFNGKTLEEIVQSLKISLNLVESKEELLLRYNTLLLRDYATQARLKPGAFELLHDLSRAGFRLGLVTSAPKTLAEAFLTKNDIRSLFEHVIAGTESIKGKPDPALFLLAIDSFAVDASRFITVEDSVYGVTASRAAQIRTLWLTEQTGQSDTLADLTTLKDHLFL